jgi:hypothetical protein
MTTTENEILILVMKMGDKLDNLLDLTERVIQRYRDLEIRVKKMEDRLG